MRRLFGGQGRLIRSLLALGVACTSFASSAQMPVDRVEPAAHEEPAVLVVDSVGMDDIELPAALRELCGRLGIRVAAPFEAVASDVALVAHIEAEGDEVELRVEDAKSHALVGARTVPRAESQALSRETLAHVLLGIVEPWVESRRRAAQTPPPPPPQELPSAQPSASAPMSVRIGIAGGPIVLARDVWGARLVGSTSWVWSARLEPSISLELQAAPPLRVHARDVHARFWSAGARLRGRLSPFQGPRGALDVALSAGADVLVVKPTSADAPTTLVQRNARPQPVLGAALLGRARLPRNVELVFGVGADIDPMPRAWLIAIDGAPSTTLLRTTLLRPYALVGVDFQARGPKPSPRGAP